MKLKLRQDQSLNLFLWHIYMKLKLGLDLCLNAFLWHIYMKLKLRRPILKFILVSYVYETKTRT